jgi:ribose transport system permease protein
MTSPTIEYQSPETKSGTTRRWGPLIRTLMPLAALVVLLVVTSAIQWSRDGENEFLTAGNLLRVIRGQSAMGIVAVGMTLVIICGGIDLSVGSMVAMSAVCGVYVMNGITNDTTAVLAGLAVMAVVGIVAGILNGSLVAWGRVAPFIATLGGLAAYRSVARTVFDGDLPVKLRSLAPLHQKGVPIPFLQDNGHAVQLYWPIVIFMAVAAVGGILLNKTRYGRYVFAVGGNERAAAYSAVPVNRIKVITYGLAGLCCAIAAVLNAATTDSVQAGQVGTLYELDAIAAVVVGGTLIAGGSGTVFGTIVGVLILGLIDNMMVFLNIPNTLQGVVKGTIIVAAAMVQQIGKRK